MQHQCIPQPSPATTEFAYHWPGRTMRETLPMVSTRLSDVMSLLSVGDTFAIAGRPLRYTVVSLAEVWSWCGWFVQAECRVPSGEVPLYIGLYAANGALHVNLPFDDPVYATVQVTSYATVAMQQLSMFGGAA